MTDSIVVTTHIARDFLQNSAYFNTVPKVVWEYVSNSVDNPKDNESVSVEVHISKNRILVADNGCGMSRNELRNFFQMHAENQRRGKGESVRGRYGTGKCAAFGIADTLRVETIKDNTLNIVELNRKDIQQYKTGSPFPVNDITVEKPTTEENGTRILVSGINVKNIELQTTIAYVERHLGRQLQRHAVVINGHICEYQEPYSTWDRIYHSPEQISNLLGDLQMVVKVSPIPLGKERAGVDILSNGIWHDTYQGTIDNEYSKRLFGEVDVRILEEKYDTEKIPPFDNTRNMTLNISNPLVASLLGWIDSCMREVIQELSNLEREQRATEEAKRLQRQANNLAKILNDDFRNLQIELEKIQRLSRQKDTSINDEIVPGNGELPTEYQLGGPERTGEERGENPAPGEEKKLGTTILPGNDLGELGQTKKNKQKVSTFHVEYRHEEELNPRSHYEREARTIIINLDHPQILKAIKDGGGIEGKRFQEICYEVACVEYSIALGYEKTQQDEFYTGSDLLFDIRDTINRLSRIIADLK